MVYNSHSGYTRTNFAVLIGEQWVIVSKCSCGAIHVYWWSLLDKELSPELPHLLDTDLPGEALKHIKGRMASELVAI